MPRFILLLAFLFGTATAAFADLTFAAARQAQVLLGADVWSTVIEVENRNEKSRYPRQLHALVFELVGVLWFYTSIDGTQSFSRHRGRLAEEKADFGPLLRDIEPGFQVWRPMHADELATVRLDATSLPNGCFIESVAAWRAQVAAGATLTVPQLLSYYADTPMGRLGHTVLTFQTENGITVIDSGTRRTKRFPLKLAADPVKLARAVLRAPVAHARWLPLAPTDEAPERGFAADLDTQAEADGRAA